MRSSWRLATFDAQKQILVAYTNEGKTLTKVYAGEIFRKAYLLFAFYRYFCISASKFSSVRQKTWLRKSYPYFYSYNVRFRVHVHDIARYAVHHRVLFKRESNAYLRLVISRGDYPWYGKILLLHPTAFLLHHLLSDDHSGSSGLHDDSLRTTRLRSFPGDRVWFTKTQNNYSNSSF